MTAATRKPRVLIVAFYFPPSGGAGVQRPLKLAGFLAEMEHEVHVLAPDDPRWIHPDPDLAIPVGVQVHRAKYRGPRGRRPAEELHGLRGARRALKKLSLVPRRLVLPDENALWLLAARRKAVAIAREHAIDVVISTSPPTHVHLIAARVKKRTDAAWIADLRDSLVAKTDRNFQKRLVRLKEKAHRAVAKLVAAEADAVVTVTKQVQDEMRALGAAGELAIIRNGADWDEFAAIPYTPDRERFRITHTGSFFGGRDPRPFLDALAKADPAVVARFVGDFRSSDRDYVAKLGLGDRIELIPFQPHATAMELQRNSEALLLLLPHEGGRGLDVIAGKVFEYLASLRPILAAAPVENTSSQIIREVEAGVVVPPDDSDAIGRALAELVARWRAGDLADNRPPEELKRRLARRTRAEEFAALIDRVQAPG